MPLRTKLVFGVIVGVSVLFMGFVVNDFYQVTNRRQFSLGEQVEFRGAPAEVVIVSYINTGAYWSKDRFVVKYSVEQGGERFTDVEASDLQPLPSP